MIARLDETEPDEVSPANPNPVSEAIQELQGCNISYNSIILFPMVL
jgi:hypothetical protein